MKCLNKYFKDSILNCVLRPLYIQKQKVNNNCKYTDEQKIWISKGIDMAINIEWQKNGNGTRFLTK